MYKYILFDLDGTLTDPGEGITNSVAYSLEKFGIKVSDKSELYKFIGPPLSGSYMEFYGFSEEDSLRAVDCYREYYREKGIFENKLYDGIKELLEKLKASDRKIILATSKPEVFAIKILEYFDIYKYFDFIGAASMDGSRNKKADVIRYVLENCKITDMSEVLMIGDRKFDVLGASEFGIRTLGVLFGYGTKEELLDAGAVGLVEKPADIFDVVMSED